MSVKAENHHLKGSLWPGLCCSALFPPFFCLLLTMSAEVLASQDSFLGKLTVPIFCATHSPHFSRVYLSSCSFLFGSPLHPQGDDYFHIFLTWFLFWFIPPCLCDLCVVQIWVGRPDGSSAHISDCGTLGKSHRTCGFFISITPALSTSQDYEWRSNKRNIWKCLIKHKCITLIN